MDPVRLAQMIIFAAAGPVMGRHHIYFAALMTAWVVTRNIRRGYIARPVYSVSAFCWFLRICLNDAENADAMGKLVQQHMHSQPDPVFGPRAEVGIWGTDAPWSMRRRRALAPLERVAESAREVGDLEFSYYARFLKIMYLTLAGDPILVLHGSLHDLANGLCRAGHTYAEPLLLRRPVQMLLAPNADARTLDLEITATEAEIAENPGSAEPYVRTVWMMVLCIYGRWSEVLAQSDKVGERLFLIVPYVHVADHTFYRGMAAAVLATAARGRKRWHYRRMLRQALARVERWSRRGPDFVHMTLLLQAERCRLGGKLRKAHLLYEEAAHGAQHQEFLHHVALAHERRGRLLEAERRSSDASRALAQAAACYRDWGCVAKAVALERECEALSVTRQHMLPKLTHSNRTV
jgi:hypothetical protein